ncbi:MAG: phosphate acetyltransferase [Gallicola sp.]|nr:phosphate acetyltransferase [Gallicola sp.]
MDKTIYEEMNEKLDGKNITIVFPEGEDERIQGAVERLYKEGKINPVLLGKVEAIEKIAKEKGFDLTNIPIIDPEKADDFEEMIDKFVERRKGKATADQACEILKDPNYYGTMMIYVGKADGMVSGAVHSTGDTVRPALQIVKTKPGVSLVSGSMLMMGKGGERFMFADVGINITMTPEQMADTAIQTAETAKLFDIDPKVAMLSFSTKGSAQHELVDAVVEATKIAQEKRPDLDIDGEMQFDAALVESVGQRKAPGSKVAGHANVFVFPDLQSGNIGYKIAQRLGGFEAIGPILQGLNKPISDLSRGCSEEDVYKLTIITANQALTDKES